MDKIAARCIELISKAKSIAPENIHLENTFEELEMDSLDKLTLAFDVEESYGIDIPESALMTIRSVQDMVTGVEQALRDKAAKA